MGNPIDCVHTKDIPEVRGGEYQNRAAQKRAVENCSKSRESNLIVKSCIQAFKFLKSDENCKSYGCSNLVTHFLYFILTICISKLVRLALAGNCGKDIIFA